MAGDSSDDEEDHKSLVPQTNTKSDHPTRRSLEISPNSTANPKTPSTLFIIIFVVFLAVSIPTAILLLFFRRPTTPSPSSFTSNTDRILDSNLLALSLLRRQQLDLLALRNLTHNPTNYSSPSFQNQLVTSLIHQISINREIQNALLSPHRPSNSNSLTGFLDGEFDAQVCKKVSRMSSRRTIEWRPKKDRFLVAVCVSGQMSNHLICLEKHMFFAALLGRVLVFPSAKFDYDYDSVLDLGHINDCFGRKVVMGFDEFAKMKRKKVKIDRFLCYMASPPCYLDEDHIKKLRSSGVEVGKPEAVWPEDAKLKTQKKRVVADIMSKFSVNDKVIAIGDMFYADVEEEWVMQPGGPLAHKCKTVIQPSRLIYLTAQRFVQTFLGSNFVALHFRRHGFLKFCNAKEESCFFPIPQAAECVRRVLEKANAPVIYLSTDAAPSETNLLQSLVVMNEKQIPLVRRPEHTSVEKWDALLYRNHLGGDNQVEAMLDKTICALSSVFIGSSGSTFTEDIMRLRRGWESASQCDEYLCQGELPNYIAEND